MAQETKNDDSSNQCKDTQRQPAIFVNHGGGPLPYLAHCRSQNPEQRQGFILRTLDSLGEYITKYKPKAICILSAHWEETKPTVLYQQNPPLYFDYYGFPQKTYELKYPAPIDMKLTDKVIKLLTKYGGYNSKQTKDTDIILNKNRGYDHGVFIPLIIARKDADIPLIQVSIPKVTANKVETARQNLRLGAILSELRDEGVMILGSGMSYHNMAGFRSNDGKIKQQSKGFNDWLMGLMEKKDVRDIIVGLLNWKDAPNALDCHPREEHLLPLLGCVGSEVSVEEMDKLLENGGKGKKEEKGGNGKEMKVVVEKEVGQYTNIDYSGYTIL